MNLIDMKVSEFLNELASKSPAPGGGSVSALAGANAASLVIMVSELTINKKKFKALEEEIKEDYFEKISIFKKNNDLFKKYIDEDTIAFNLIMDAFKMSKNTEEEIKSRNEAIQKATVECIKVPMQVCLTALECLRNIKPIIDYSNRNTVSDQGVAVLMFYSAFSGAAMNVLINIKGLNEEHVVKDYKDVIEKLTYEASNLKDDLLEEVNYLLK